MRLDKHEFESEEMLFIMSPIQLIEFMKKALNFKIILRKSTENYPLFIEKYIENSYFKYGGYFWRYSSLKDETSSLKKLPEHVKLKSEK